MKRLLISHPCPVNLTNANPRKEMHGEDSINAIDLDFRMPLAPNDLDTIVANPDHWKSALWGEDGMIVDGTIKAVDITEIRENLTFRLHEKDQPAGQAEGWSNARIKIKKFQPREHFIVDVYFQVSINASADDMGRFCDLQKSDITISIEEMQRDIEDPDGN